MPIVPLTAQASREAHERCLEAGMDDLARPIAPEDLAVVLQRWRSGRGRDERAG